MKSVLTLILLLLLSSCVEPKEAKNKSKIIASMGESVAKQFPSVEHLTIEALSKMNANSYILVDVRSSNETKVSMLPGAILSSVFEKNEHKYKGKTIVAYCTIGYRSSKYVKRLNEKGIKALNLQESILGWAVRGMPLFSSGQETKKVHVYSDAWNILPEGYTGVYK